MKKALQEEGEEEEETWEEDGDGILTRKKESHPFPLLSLSYCMSLCLSGVMPNTQDACRITHIMRCFARNSPMINGKNKNTFTTIYCFVIWKSKLEMFSMKRSQSDLFRIIYILHCRSISAEIFQSVSAYAKMCLCNKIRISPPPSGRDLQRCLSPLSQSGKK